jgi:hypothetical protein
MTREEMAALAQKMADLVRVPRVSWWSPTTGFRSKFIGMQKKYRDQTLQKEGES